METDFNTTAETTNDNSSFFNYTEGIPPVVNKSTGYSTIVWIRLVIEPVLIIFGTIGNLLSFYIMRTGSLRNVSTCFYMSILALADTGKYMHLFRVQYNGYTCIWVQQIAQISVGQPFVVKVITWKI